jgi:2-oxoglutarate dehydrogenase complex dihydrolipoamide succinyltransferase (E2) component
MATKITMPEMGEGVIEGTIGRWLKKEGDKVDQYEPLLEIETDKVTTEATAETAGTLLKILVSEGETVEVGTVLAYIGEPGEAVNGDAEPAAQPEAKKEAEPAAASQPRQKSSNGAPPSRSKPYTGRISPVVARIAGEHDVDLNQVPGTGRDGRITKKDILAYVEQRESAPEPEAKAESAPQPKAEPVSAPPKPAAATAVPGEIMQLTRMRQAIADHMVRSKQTSPHVTTVHEIDFSAVVAHRNKHKGEFARDGVKLTFTPYLVAAVVQALKQHPLVNSSWTDDGILLKREINIGMATAIDEGLIVPVIKNADDYSLRGLARTVNDLAERARTNKLRPDEIQGGTFSITNHGIFGSLFANPIINQPQCGILGVGAIEKRVKVTKDDAIVIRPCAYVSFTFDHRILDGMAGDQFVLSIKQALESWS